MPNASEQFMLIIQLRALIWSSRDLTEVMVLLKPSRLSCSPDFTISPNFQLKTARSFKSSVTYFLKF